MAHGLSGWPGTRKEYDGKLGDEEMWDRGTWIAVSEGAKNTKVFVAHVNAHLRVTSVEEDLTIMWIGYPVLWTPGGLFLWLPLSLPHWAHGKSGHGGRDRGHAWAQQRLALTEVYLAKPLMITQSAKRGD